MYISNDRKFIFIAIPKTGCSTIQYELTKAEFNKNVSNTTIWNHKVPEVYHSTFEMVLKNLNVVEGLGFNVLDIKTQNFSDFYKFTDYYVKFGNKMQSKLINNYIKIVFVRNPWDRFVSAYLDMRSANGNPNRYSPFVDISQVPNYYKSFNFKDFKDFCLKFEKSGWKNDIHFKPQNEFISVNGKIVADFIGRFENLEEDVTKLFDKLSLKMVGDIGHIHKRSNKKDYHNYYDEESKKIIENIYKKDIELFAYNF